MSTPANSKDKPSPADTPSHRPVDNGGKAVKKKSDETYHDDEPHSGAIAKKHEREEQPVDPITNPPKEKGMEKGKVQP